MFSGFKEFQLSLIEYFHVDICHITLVHSLHLNISHDCVFMIMICAL